MNLEIIYQDDNYVAINKPHGLAVHKSGYVGNADAFAVQELRDQLRKKVFPCHRIDRKTSGVLLFALSSEANKFVQEQFMYGVTKKTYWTIVRGYTEDYGEIDYPLINEKGTEQDALTLYKTLQKVEIPISSGKFPTSRYSFLEVFPKTGRMHQIRKHMAHIFHPIIGDRPHGCNKQNKFFKEQFSMNTMLLHARELSFYNPYSEEEINITANLHSEFNRMIIELGFNVNSNN